MQDAVAEAPVLVASRMTYVETCAALTRARATGRLTRSGHIEKRRRFERFWSETAKVPVTTAILERAARLAERHILRAHDALQLASALTVRTDDLVLASWDDDLTRAAEAEGLALL